jgi:selenocysteine-specific elongation factor
MVAGASGIDLYLMTVAADDGVMPQTREHALVLKALGIDRGVVAVTKSDVTDPEVAMIEASELLPHAAEVVPVSARTGSGLDALREALERVASSVVSRSESSAPARLHIDRVFTIRGAGTVVTGTLWSGMIGRGDELVVLPAGRHVRVRAVQVHDEATDRAAAGQRVAVNLVGIAVADITRGDVLVAADASTSPTYLIDAEIALGDADPDHERVQVHHGTRETAARAVWLGGNFWQLRLEQPLVALGGDRVVVRQIAPPDTLGGGVVLDAHPRKHGPSRDLLVALERLSRGEPIEEVPRTTSEPAAAASAPCPAPAIPRPLSQSAQLLEGRLREARFEPPLDSDLNPADLAALRDAGRAVRVTRNLHYHPDVLAGVRQRIIDLATHNGGAVTLAQLRDELGTSRKFAQALLEHFDSEKLTIRRGDEHVLRTRDLAR